MFFAFPSGKNSDTPFVCASHARCSGGIGAAESLANVRDRKWSNYLKVLRPVGGLTGASIDNGGSWPHCGHDQVDLITWRVQRRLESTKILNRD
jgi:hypothetical protein